MPASVYSVLTWLIVGLAGGSLAALALTMRTRGFGVFRNLLLGVTGALVGGGVFAAFNLFPGLDKITISMRDVFAAFLGSLVVFVVHWLWQKFGSRQGVADADGQPPPP